MEGGRVGRREEEREGWGKEVKRKKAGEGGRGREGGREKGGRAGRGKRSLGKRSRCQQFKAYYKLRLLYIGK